MRETPLRLAKAQRPQRIRRQPRHLLRRHPRHLVTLEAHAADLVDPVYDLGSTLSLLAFREQPRREQGGFLSDLGGGSILVLRVYYS